MQIGYNPGPKQVPLARRRGGAGGLGGVDRGLDLSQLVGENGAACAFRITRSDKEIMALTRSFVAKQTMIFTR